MATVKTVFAAILTVGTGAWLLSVFLPKLKTGWKTGSFKGRGTTYVRATSLVAYWAAMVSTVVVCLFAVGLLWAGTELIRSTLQ